MPHNSYKFECVLFLRMTVGSQDSKYPACCSRCPYWEPFAASCGHSLNQSLIREVKDNRTCSIYESEKTQAMDRLIEDLQRGER
jgi:hypothetical protein